MEFIYLFFKAALLLIGKSDERKFQYYKDMGIVRVRERKQPAKAMKFYKRALNYATTKEQKGEIWRLILYIHTDRQIATQQTYAEETGIVLDWEWGADLRNLPTDYNRPPRKDLLR